VTTLRIEVDLTVNADADAEDVADWLFNLLVNTDDDWHPAVDSVDGTTARTLP
jgi:hypothetical protein